MAKEQSASPLLAQPEAPYRWQIAGIYDISDLPADEPRKPRERGKSRLSSLLPTPDQTRAPLYDPLSRLKALELFIQHDEAQAAAVSEFLGYSTWQNSLTDKNQAPLVLEAEVRALWLKNMTGTATSYEATLWAQVKSRFEQTSDDLAREAFIHYLAEWLAKEKSRQLLIVTDAVSATATAQAAPPEAEPKVGSVLEQSNPRASEEVAEYYREVLALGLRNYTRPQLTKNFPTIRRFYVNWVVHTKHYLTPRGKKEKEVFTAEEATFIYYICRHFRELDRQLKDSELDGLAQELQQMITDEASQAHGSSGKLTTIRR